MKTCYKCKEEKAFEFFGKLSSSQDGYRHICKSCRKGEHTNRYEATKDEWNKRSIEWRKANSDKAKAIWETYRKKHKDERYANKREWAKNNKAVVNAYNRKRHADKQQRVPKWLTDFDILHMECLYQVAAMRTKESGYSWHVDHIIPLNGKNVSGLHCPSNLRVIPATENLRKYNSYGN